MSDKKLNILVLSGGPSSEHEVSLETGRVILSALDRDKYDVDALVIPKDGRWMLPQAPIDLVFIAMHGAWGEDGTIQAFLEMHGMPYTGSGVLASALAMDKLRSSHIFSHHGLHTPQTTAVDIQEWQCDPSAIVRRLKLPCVVKPCNGGSSVGVTIVQSFDDVPSAIDTALLHDDRVLIQDFLSGTEVTCAVIDDGQQTLALPPTQIIPQGSTFFDYRAKYTPGACEEVTPPRLPTSTIERIQHTALATHHALGCIGMSRTDMILMDEDLYVLELNTIPGMTKTSLLPQAAAAAGITFPQLLDHIITSGLRRPMRCMRPKAEA